MFSAFGGFLWGLPEYRRMTSLYRNNNALLLAFFLRSQTMDFSTGVILCCFLIHCLVNPYSAEKSTKVPDITTEERPFRMNKVNLLWEKARKRLSGIRLTDLYVDLKVQDKHEAALKKLRTENADKDGLQEAQVNVAFREIIEKYGLEDLFASNSYNTNTVPFEHDERANYFSDKKLQSMWKRAQESGFSEQDLAKLRQEFWHQQMKIDELNFLKNELGNNDNTDNEIDFNKRHEKATEEQASLEHDLKMKHKDIKDGYYKLESQFSNFEVKQPEFKDNRVYQLWAMAQKTNWSQEELDSFKEELKHFEHRLIKHDYYEEQLQRSANALQDKAMHDKPEKHLHLEQKAHDLGHKVKKLHNELKMRVHKAFTEHTEL